MKLDPRAGSARVDRRPRPVNGDRDRCPGRRRRHPGHQHRIPDVQRPLDVERIETLKLGESLDVAAYTLRLERITKVQGPNFTADDATISVSRQGTQAGELHPQRRLFPLQNQNTGLTAIRSGLFADLYVALGEPDAAGAWTVRAYWKPIVSWIWLGGLVMASGGMVSLSDRRWRIGVAARLGRAVRA